MNRLSTTSSPYLLQHADNPVEWYPWGEEAFEKARREQKPIFLSIGYSTCHWCHVMAHESFENPETAALMNGLFVNVKVDREERPDVDRLYMAYVQALTGSGGWPMSVWLTPELKPFFGGTYFPPGDRYGRAGFPSVLRQISQVWTESPDKVEREAMRALEALRESGRGVSGEVAETDAARRAFEHFARMEDPEWGGFGSAPKFPRPSVLFFLLRHAEILDPEKSAACRGMVFRMLDRMAAGGIHDHLGGGFHRYSVDRFWHVPHFEKMLYDQAQLALAYLEAWQVTGEEPYRVLVDDILGYVLRDMAAPEGGFYSAEDADSLLSHDSSEHAEGAFFVWTEQEIEGLLEPEAARLFCGHYGVGAQGNVDPSSDPHGELSGKNVLMEQRSLEESARHLGVAVEVLSASLAASREVLCKNRALRPRPHLDDKILCAWNGLMISALARAGAALDNAVHVAAAVKAATFLKERLCEPSSGELRRNWRKGRVSESGFAEDYAFLIQGLLDLYEATFDIGWLQWAGELQSIMDRLFWDEGEGGYFGSAAGDPHLLVRMKEDYDGAEPSANSVAALNLIRLSRMLGDASAAAKAERIFALSAGILASMPSAVPQLLVALGVSAKPPSQIVIAGNPEDPRTQALLASARRGFHPDRVLLLADGGEGQSWLAEWIPSLAGMKPVDGKPALYRCENFTCSAPVTEPGVESLGVLP